MFRQALTAEEEKELFSRLAKIEGPLMYVRHFFQPDFMSVNMMNIVREPVSRIISAYYFKLKGWGKKEKPPKSWFKDFDSCVRDGGPECQVGLGGMTMQVTFFCGSHVQCANSTNPMVLQAAKYNLENK